MIFDLSYPLNTVRAARRAVCDGAPVTTGQSAAACNGSPPVLGLRASACAAEFHLGSRQQEPGRKREAIREMTSKLPASSDVVVIGAGNAAFCAALAAAESKVSVLVLERAPEAESGGNSRFTAGAFRCVYDGVEDLRRADARPDGRRGREHRLRHLHRGAVLRRHGPRHRVPHRPRAVRAAGHAQQATPCCGCAPRASASRRSTAGRPSRSTASSSSGAA